MTALLFVGVLFVGFACLCWVADVVDGALERLERDRAYRELDRLAFECRVRDSLRRGAGGASCRGHDSPAPRNRKP